MNDKKYNGSGNSGNKRYQSGNHSYQGKRDDQPIFAPFNFVPLNEKVFFPDHASLITQDVPFRDQVSGSISVALTAESPVFIKDSASDQLNGSFCCVHDAETNTYFIPATSVKGCIRSVLETMSFGKMAFVGNKNFETKQFKNQKKLTIHSVIPGQLLNSGSLKNPENSETFKPDLAECIFGYTYGGKSLRGRVQFGHAMADENTVKVDSKMKSFAAYSPHPSYYPIYSSKGIQWDQPDAMVKGRKRYLIQNVDPVKKNEDASKEPKFSGKKSTSTAKVHFLEADATFSLTVRFHNLRPFELGALLSALTFHGNNESCRHNIGFGKPYGYGKMKVSDPELVFQTYDGLSEKRTEEIQKDWHFYVGVFEEVMNKFKPDWRHSIQIRELLAIAGGWKKYVGYMNIKQYGNAKKNHKYLKWFSDINPSHFKIPNSKSK